MAKRQPLNVRYNNPGNLRTATLDDAYNFWGQDMVKGRDDSGFIQFVSPRAGIDSLYQQLRVDAGRKHTLGSFLDKFTPVDDDPEGNAISKETVPNWLGASLDTPLSDIDPRDLAEAITKKEGGQAAVDFFGPQLAPFAEMDRAQGDTIQRANEAELARFSTPREEPPAPETAPNAALERVLGVDASFPSRDRARSNMPASVLNSINAPVFEEQGPPVPAEIGSTNAPAYEEQGPPIPTGMESILGSIDSARRGIPASVLNSIQSQESPFFQEPSPNFNDMRVKATEEKMAGGTYAPARTNEETEKQNPNFRFFEAGSGKPLSFSLGKPLFNPPGPVQGAASRITGARIPRCALPRAGKKYLKVPWGQPRDHQCAGVTHPRRW
jgi:hypothetical protein